MKKQFESMDKDRLVYDAWERHATHHPDRIAIIHWDALKEPYRWSYKSLLDEAIKIAGHLVHKGVDKGDVCALILRHNRHFYPIYIAITAIGAIPAVLAYPNARLHPDKFVHGLSGMIQKSGLDWILTERDLEAVINPFIKTKQNTIEGVLLPLEWTAEKHPEIPNHESIRAKRDTVNSTHPFLLQHSSGTTGLQKAVIMSHAAILNHVKHYSEAICLSEHDKVVNWLPLYHDMGLIAAFHMPLAFGIPSIQLDPFQWVSIPSTFFRAISEEKATLAWLPNFAYNFMADRVREDEMENIDLSSVRMFINCSEMVRHVSHDKFYSRFCKHGITRDTLSTCYAMAEATFAVTQTEPGHEAARLTVDRGALAKNKVCPPDNRDSSRICMSSGKPIRGCSIKIVDKTGAPLSEGNIGTIAITSSSLFDGYRNDPEKTRQVLSEGQYTSGDLGFIHDGECYVIGRKDDVIITAGKNIFPEDIEDALNRIPGVIPGRVIAFGTDDEETGTEDVCVIAETLYENEDEKDALTMAIKKAGMAIDVTIVAVHLAPPRWLIKSSSGKPSRKTNKERILSKI